ncbi:hypothetical protein ACFLQU_01925 [Verrucomicrobiota bacterium]
MDIKSLSLLSSSSRIGLVAILVLLAHAAEGQVRRPVVGRGAAKVDPDAVRIRKFTGLGSKGKIRTPVFRASSSRATINPPGDWARITTEYSTSKDWIDELVFHYYVMTETKTKGQKPYNFFKATVRYGDIERSPRHFSTVFLKPNTVKRFGEPIGIAIEIVYGGQVVATKSDVLRSGKLPDGEWWKNPRVTDSPKVTSRGGYLLNRSETPFALIDMDDYETIR